MQKHCQCLTCCMSALKVQHVYARVFAVCLTSISVNTLHSEVVKTPGCVKTNSFGYETEERNPRRIRNAFTTYCWAWSVLQWDSGRFSFFISSTGNVDHETMTMLKTLPAHIPCRIEWHNPVLTSASPYFLHIFYNSFRFKKFLMRCQGDCVSFVN